MFFFFSKNVPSWDERHQLLVRESRHRRIPSSSLRGSQSGRHGVTIILLHGCDFEAAVCTWVVAFPVFNIKLSAHDRRGFRIVMYRVYTIHGARTSAKTLTVMSQL